MKKPKPKPPNCKMLVKFNKKGHLVGIMPAINPDGSPTKKPRGWTWIDAYWEDYSV